MWGWNGWKTWWEGVLRGGWKEWWNLTVGKYGRRDGGRDSGMGWKERMWGWDGWKTWREGVIGRGRLKG